jgi:hypothetical protein
LEWTCVGDSNDEFVAVHWLVPMSFNTVYSDLRCPFCQEKIASGVGFQVGVIEHRSYKLGDSLNWAGDACRPKKRPVRGNMRTIGYFNCDNPACSSWFDCFPEVQTALVVIKGNRIVEVSVYNGALSGEKFEILGPSKGR